MKHFFRKGMGKNKCTFPLTEDQIKEMQDCELVNPMVGKSHGLKIPDDFDQEKGALEILDVRMQVLNDEYPQWFMEKYWPFTFEMAKKFPKALKLKGLSRKDPKGLADVVHMDNPMDLPLALTKWLSNPRYGGSANIKNHHNKYKQFIETVLHVNEDIGDWQKSEVKKCFEAKYYFGQERVEETLERLTGKKGSLFTAYPEGCPNHPQTPQGHLSIGGGGVQAIIKHFDLTKEQLEQCLTVLYLWGQFRCLAGVHVGIDAIMSLILSGFSVYMKPELVEKYTE